MLNVTSTGTDCPNTNDCLTGISLIFSASTIMISEQNKLSACYILMETLVSNKET